MKRLIWAVLGCLCLTGCAASPAQPETLASLKQTGSMELRYAEQFAVDYFEGGYAEVTIADGSDYLLVPEGAEIPAETGDCVVLQLPLRDLYVAASSAVDLFDGIGALDKVTMTSTSEANWSLPAVQEALADGSMQYVGKYSAPDYEMLLGCPLAIESTMIYHSPETREQLEQLGIPVLTERSSYETHPLGRMEWVRLYGLLVGKADEAEQFFSEQAEIFETLTASLPPEEERKTVAFFSISANGYVTVHKPGDYISRMIELAGGQYCFTAEALHVEENALSTMNIQRERFYELAKDADVLIYNSAIDSELQTMDELLAKDPVLADLRAVQNGAVWCTGKNLFQQTTGAAAMIADLHTVLTGGTDELVFLHQLT